MYFSLLHNHFVCRVLRAEIPIRKMTDSWKEDLVQMVGSVETDGNAANGVVGGIVRD